MARSFPLTSQEPALKAYHERLRMISQIPVSPKAKTMIYTPEAKVLWINFVNEIEQNMQEDGIFRPISGFANKLPEHAARLAAVVWTVEHPECLQENALVLPEVAMQMGIDLARYYLDERLRLIEQNTLDPEVLLAEKLRVWLCEKWPESYVCLSNILYKGPNPLRDKLKAEKALDILADHGWVYPVVGPVIIEGQNRRDAWQIVRG
jgi:hypothetical protein